MTAERIDLNDGKYSVINDDGRLTALRYGEPWRNLSGDNLIYWMFVEIVNLKAEIAQMAETAERCQ
mgnify:FL=1